jgi:hypothetical protein
MGFSHNRAVGFVLTAGALLIANTSDAKVPVVPLKSATAITQAAQGCGPGRWRDPYGHCHSGYGGAYGPPAVNPDPHCTYEGCCPRGFTVQGGICKPYQGPVGPGPGWGYYH